MSTKKRKFAYDPPTFMLPFLVLVVLSTTSLFPTQRLTLYAGFTGALMVIVGIPTIFLGVKLWPPAMDLRSLMLGTVCVLIGLLTEPMLSAQMVWLVPMACLGTGWLMNVGTTKEDGCMQQGGVVRRYVEGVKRFSYYAIYAVAAIAALYGYLDPLHDPTPVVWVLFTAFACAVIQAMLSWFGWRETNPS